jgi:exosome complex component RRP4
MGLLVKEKDIVVPGEAVAEGLDYLPGPFTYRLNDRVIAKRVGVVSVEGRAVKLLPLSGRYLPKIGDVVIGRVYDIVMSGWLIDLNCAYNSMLNSKDVPRFIRKGEDLTRYYDVGDYLRVQIFNVTSQNLVDVSMKEPGLMKLTGGRVIKINPNKVPRVIGKQGSMISLIKEKTGTMINVGQNGLVWIKGNTPEDELRAVNAITKIEGEAHLEGLTERITQFLEQKVMHNDL